MSTSAEGRAPLQMPAHLLRSTLPLLLPPAYSDTWVHTHPLLAARVAASLYIYTQRQPRTLTKHLQCARTYSKCFMYINLIQSHHSPLQQALRVLPIFLEKKPGD